YWRSILDVTGIQNKSPIINSIIVDFDIYYDEKAPTIELVNPQNNTVLVSFSTIQMNVTDYLLDSVWFTWDNLRNQTLTSPYEVVVPSDEGYHWLTVYAEDSVGHLTVETYLFTVNVAPEIALNSPLNGSIVTVGMDCSNIFTDEIGGLHWIWYNWDNQPEVIIDNLAYYSLTEFTNFWLVPETEGWHYLTINVNDTYGLVNTILLEVFVDITPPVITLHNPDNDTSIETSLVIDLEINDYSLEEVWVNWDESVNQSLVSPYQIDVPTEEGYHWLTVYATDSVGHVTVQKYRWFVVIPTTTTTTTTTSTTSTSKRESTPAVTSGFELVPLLMALFSIMSILRRARKQRMMK
ncbi:MAG: hypothetical protein ACW99Q_15775, partial [Candidatus Kariarchaeaceae archaeon]